MIDRLLATTQLYLNWARLEWDARSCIRNKQHPKPARQKTILLLVELFPPLISGGVYRPLSIARFAARHGWKVTVVVTRPETKATPAGKKLLTSLPKQVKVFHLSDGRPSTAWKLTPRLDGGYQKTINVAREVIKRIGLEFDVVVASGPPFYNFVAAYFIARKRRGVLVYDYRDEWTACPFDFVCSGAFDKFWEKRCLRKADRIVFVTSSMRRHALSQFPMLEEAKAVVVENGVDLNGINLEYVQPRSDELITISFLGAIGGHTDIKAILRDFSVLLERRQDFQEKIMLRFIGQKTSDTEELLSSHKNADNFASIDHVGRGEAFQIMKQSSILLLILDERFERYRPGKLYDYIASCVPILAYGATGESQDVIELLQAGVVVPKGDVDALECAIDRLLNWPRGPDVANSRKAWMEKFDRDHLAERFFKSVEAVMEGKSAEGTS